MNSAVEFVLGILLDGAMDAVGSRKVPLLLHIALGAVLLICFGASAGSSSLWGRIPATSVCFCSACC